MAKSNDGAGNVAGQVNYAARQESATGKNVRAPEQATSGVSAGSMLGYQRVSRSDQNLERQTDALLTAGVRTDQIWTDDGVSGSKSSRPGMDALMAYVRPNDTIVVTSLDRLSRQKTSEAIRLIEDLTDRGIGIRVLNLGLDTSNASETSMLILKIMSLLAEAERTVLVERTREGLEAARLRGRVGGRPPVLSEERRQEVLRMREQGRPVSVIARLLAVSERTIRRVINEERDRRDWPVGSEGKAS